MHFKTIIGAAAVAAALAVASSASAAINAPVPTNAYISVGGLDWAWANPLPGDPDTDLAYQSLFGWRLATDEELANAPLAVQFIFAGANVPLGGSDAFGAHFEATNSALTGAAACASAYFSGYDHCDWSDGLGQPDGPWWGMDDAYFLADQLYVRETGVTTPVGAVPEPTTWALLIAGFGGVGVMMRRRRAALAA